MEETVWGPVKLQGMEGIQDRSPGLVRPGGHLGSRNPLWGYGDGVGEGTADINSDSQ
jgi:hypothetical protein